MGTTDLLEEKQMSCIHCHSRPAHRFLTPEEAVNRSLSAGALDRSLPFIKKIAVAALAKHYASRDAALAGIEHEVVSFYRERFQGAVLAREESLSSAVAELKRIHQHISFPAMKANWSTYTDHSSHRRAPGCFRCHSGRHVSEAGDTLDQDCSSCHAFFEKAKDSESLIEVAANGSTFHPFQHASHSTIDCWRCHTETASPYTECHDCHPESTGEHAMQFECSICHKPGKLEESTTTCATCHPAGASTLHADGNHGDCTQCHLPHGWKVAAASCGQSECHEGAGDDYLKEHLPAFRGVLSHMSGLPVGGK